MAVGLAAIVAVLVVVLLQQAQRRSGTDLTPNGAFVAAIGTGQSICETGELLPADTSALRVTATSYGKSTPSLHVTFTGPGERLVSSGSVSAGWREGVVQIPITHVSHALEDTRACLRNNGPVPIALAGAAPDPGFGMTVAGKPFEGRIRYDFMRPGRESWFELLPTIVYRSTLAKAGFLRHWAWAAALVLMLLAIGFAARIVIREESW
jgi:hypothetical protein